MSSAIRRYSLAEAEDRGGAIVSVWIHIETLAWKLLVVSKLAADRWSPLCLCNSDAVEKE